MEPLESASKFVEQVYEALKSWQDAAYDVSPFTELQLFQQTMQQNNATVRETTHKLLLALLEELRRHHGAYAELITRRFVDGEKMHVVAASMNISEGTAYRRQNEAVAQMAHFLQVWELEAQQQWQTRLEQRLEWPGYTHLVGVDDHLAQLSNLLIQPDQPWLISIEGIGGIGKTSLADALARHLINQQRYYTIGWVSARSYLFEVSGQSHPLPLAALNSDQLIEQLAVQLMPDLSQSKTMSNEQIRARLKQRLKQAPHLIFIDNLETVADVTELLPLLRDLTNPSKFLLTSRESLYHEPAIYHFVMPELSQVDTLQLIRSEIETHNLTHLQQASDDDLRPIYQAVGGNPLAIRLVVGQTHVFPLAVILADLAQARSRSVEALYTHIYRRAWEALDEPTRSLFLTMPLLTEEGEQLEDFVQLSGLDFQTVHTGLQQLVDLNLVNSVGDLHQRRYSIHNLTRTFLQEQVLKWKA